MTGIEPEIINALCADEIIRAIAREHVQLAATGVLREMSSWPYNIAVLFEYRDRGGAMSCPMYGPAIAVRRLVADYARELPDDAAACVREVLNPA